MAETLEELQVSAEVSVPLLLNIFAKPCHTSCLDPGKPMQIGIISTPTYFA